MAAGRWNGSYRRSERVALAAKVGTCEICGAHERELRILAMADFMGWACGECRKQLADCLPRRWCGTTEETEPGE